jgi:hypothetical protein
MLEEIVQNKMNFDRANLFNQGVRSFQFQISNNSIGVPAGNNFMFFDSTGLNEDTVEFSGRGRAQNPDTSLTSESTVTNTVIKNVLRSGQIIVVKNIVYIVNDPGLNPSGTAATINTALSNDFTFTRCLIDGRVLRGADVNPNTERRNYMYQEDLILIPGPFEIDSTWGFAPLVNYQSIVTLIFEVDELR